MQPHLARTAAVTLTVSLLGLGACNEGTAGVRQAEPFPEGETVNTSVPNDGCTCEGAGGDTVRCTCWESCREEEVCAIECPDGECRARTPALAVCEEIECSEGETFEFPTFDCILSGCTPEPSPYPAPCAEFGGVALEPDELMALYPRRTEASGTLQVETAGWYEIFNERLAESGPSQRNESAYFRIPNSSGPGFPQESNCGSDFVLVDDDNDGPVEEPRSIGTFWLDAGENRIEMHHYCKYYSDGQCLDLHDSEDPDKTCDADNYDSVHFQASTLCIVPLI